MPARLLYQAKLSITIDGEIKAFYDKTKFNQHLSTNSADQKVLELHPEKFNNTKKTHTHGGREDNINNFRPAN